MKSFQIQKIILISFSLAIFLFSCSEKEDQLFDVKEEVIPQTADIKDTPVLTFNTRSDYDAIFTNPQLLEDKSKANKSFVSLKSRIDGFRSGDGLRNSTLQILEDTLFEGYGMLPKILNKDRIVKIGKHYIKIDLLEERALVLKEEHADQYTDLAASNIENENIMLFSTNDEVLELLSIGSTGKVQRIKNSCGDPTAVRKNCDPFSYNGNRRRLKAKVVYQRAAIYFSVLANAKAEKRRLRIWSRDRNATCNTNYDFRFGLKCGRAYNEQGSVFSSSGEATYRPYEGTTSLAYYRLAADLSSSNASRILSCLIQDNF
ncbi:MAG: hypothetical protein AAF705_03380 [Bacteroidota bacterium]